MIRRCGKSGSSLPCAAQAIDEAGISSHQSLVQVEKHEPSLARVHGTQHPKQLVDQVRRVSRFLPRAAHEAVHESNTSYVLYEYDYHWIYRLHAVVVLLNISRRKEKGTQQSVVL